MVLEHIQWSIDMITTVAELELEGPFDVSL